VAVELMRATLRQTAARAAAEALTGGQIMGLRLARCRDKDSQENIFLQSEWPADEVERRAVAALIPYARNARTHSPEQVDQIAASIREWGWTVPVLVDEQGGINAGHGRVLAAHKLAIDEVPVMVASGWSEAQKRGYVLADNKLALNAGWDDDLHKDRAWRSPGVRRVPGDAGFMARKARSVR
jgi:hypothetical protein